MEPRPWQRKGLGQVETGWVAGGLELLCGPRLGAVQIERPGGLIWNSGVMLVLLHSTMGTSRGCLLEMRGKGAMSRALF